VVCSQGLQFFPDKAAGLAEMARVAVPGGRLGAADWTQMVDSPFFEPDDQAQHAAVRYVEDRLVDYRTDEGVDVPFVTYIATATT
jgi:ubiquinone/menaquinone biosynthesis C-methylase UbiE